MAQPHLLSLDELKRGQQLTRWLAAPSQREPGQAGHPVQTRLTDAASHKLICTLEREWRKESQQPPASALLVQSDPQACIWPPEPGRAASGADVSSAP